MWLLTHQQPVYYWGHFPVARCTRSGKFRLQTGHHLTLAELRKDYEQVIQDEWNDRWANSDHGPWTHRIWPSVVARQRSPFKPTFWLSQAVTGHGCFAEFLHRIGRRASLYCHCSSQIEQTPHHIFLECPSFIPHIPIPSTYAPVSEWLSWLRRASDIVITLWRMENPHSR